MDSSDIHNTSILNTAFITASDTQSGLLTTSSDHEKELNKYALARLLHKWVRTDIQWIETERCFENLCRDQDAESSEGAMTNHWLNQLHGNVFDDKPLPEVQSGDLDSRDIGRVWKVGETAEMKVTPDSEKDGEGHAAAMAKFISIKHEDEDPKETENPTNGQERVHDKPELAVPSISISSNDLEDLNWTAIQGSSRLSLMM